MIVVPSPNTAREVIVLAPGWRPGAVARAERVVARPGGKPLNVARFAVLMGGRSCVVALADAALAADVERDCRAGGVELELVVTAAPSRTDVTIVAGGVATVVNGPGETPAPGELAAFLERVEAHCRGGNVLVVAGSLPGATPPSLVDELAAIARRAGATLLVDASGPALEVALRAAPHVAKVNAAELAAARGCDEEAAFREGRRLAPEPANLVVTAGARGLRAWLDDGSRLEVRPPPVSAVNPLGAGDAISAAIAVALDAARPIREGLIEGAAWAAAKVTEADLVIDARRAAALRAGVRVRVEHETRAGR